MTYLIIPASNINSSTDEIDSIRTWASTNNINLNLKKSVEIVFVDSGRHRQVQLPNPLDGIPCISSIKIIGITVSSHLSVSEHVSTVIGRCAQTIHYMPSEFFTYMDFVMKPYIMSIGQLLFANSFMQ